VGKNATPRGHRLKTGTQGKRKEGNREKDPNDKNTGLNKKKNCNKKREMRK